MYRPAPNAKFPPRRPESRFLSRFPPPRPTNLPRARGPAFTTAEAPHVTHFQSHAERNSGLAPFRGRPVPKWQSSGFPGQTPQPSSHPAWAPPILPRQRVSASGWPPEQTPIEFFGRRYGVAHSDPPSPDHLDVSDGHFEGHFEGLTRNCTPMLHTLGQSTGAKNRPWIGHGPTRSPGVANMMGQRGSYANVAPTNFRKRRFSPCVREANWFWLYRS